MKLFEGRSFDVFNSAQTRRNQVICSRRRVWGSAQESEAAAVAASLV